MRLLIDVHAIPVDLCPPEADEREGENRAYTPLMGAVANRQRGAAELLLRRNADPNRLYPSVTAVTQYNTPIRVAAQRGDADPETLFRLKIEKNQKIHDFRPKKRGGHFFDIFDPPPPHPPTPTPP